ncbi:MAG: M50 family metallopeptidase [Candidatus Pacebacteria bacterium]|nr:M50 family metallopeptidase [Candidatus Paceibacterota bacterium]
MSIVIFIVVIVALIVVHELGHFVAAKLSGMRVDEFGLGYPPRALLLGKKGETEYTLNWLPFGGFVKIYGEDPGTVTAQTQLATGQVADTRSFSTKSRLAQAIVLAAGVTMNLVFAYILVTGALIAGTPRVLSEDEIPIAQSMELAVANVLPGSPAAEAGLLPGDSILSAEDGHFVFTGFSPAEFMKFVTEGRGNTTIALSVRHGSGEKATLFARPETGIISSDPSRAALGVEVATIGIVPLSFGAALVEGAKLTWGATVLTAQGLWQFFAGVFTLSVDLSQVAGPVGIAGAVGTASSQGWGDLFSIMAIISINLALINLIPVPALDGGRLLFVIIESIIRRPIKPNVSQAINAIGFVFLVLLMLVVTAHDIFRIVG